MMGTAFGQYNYIVLLQIMIFFFSKMIFFHILTKIPKFLIYMLYIRICQSYPWRQQWTVKAVFKTFFCQKSVPLLRPWMHLEVDLEFPGDFKCQFRVKGFWDPFSEFCCSFGAALESYRLLDNDLSFFLWGGLVWVFLSCGTAAICRSPHSPKKPEF